MFIFSFNCLKVDQLIFLISIVSDSCLRDGVGISGFLEAGFDRRIDGTSAESRHFSELFGNLNAIVKQLTQTALSK